MNNATRLRNLLKKPGIIVAPGAYDTLSARIIARAGFDAVYMTGYGQAASCLGKPDVGLLTMSEMVERAAYISAAVDVPVIADADTGFGNPINTYRTVQEYERAGVAAIQLEDQVSPKKCGHMLGREVISTEEMVAKIHAAVDARKDPDLVIIARTDARTFYGLEEAISRCKAYAAAGADVVFLESPETVEEMKKVTSEIKVPALANMVEGGRTPLLSGKELEEIGYKIAIFPVSSVFTAARALIELMAELKTRGTTRGFLGKMLKFNEFNDLVGLPDILEMEQRYRVKRK